MTTMASPLEHARRTAADRPSAICGTTTTTYGQTWQRCRQLVGALVQLGLRRGDRVAVVAANCHRYLEIYQAVPAGGFVLVPLNTRQSQAELTYALTDAGVRVLITDRDPGPLADLVEHVVLLPTAYDALLAAAPQLPLGEGVHEDDLAGLFYTGGTTGGAKGVMLSHRNLITNAFNALVVVGLRVDDRWLAMAPMFHAAGTFAVLACTWRGVANVVLPTFAAGPALDLLERHRCTTTIGVPTMLAAMVEEQARQPRDLRSMRVLTHGAAPIATEVVRRAAATFPGAELVHLYGATETAPLITASSREELLLDGPHARACGQPLPGVEVRIEDPIDGVGEVLVRGHNVMQGYWGKPEQTAAALVNGWYRTGDLGRLDDGGYLHLVDRTRDMLVTGGENVYSTEVEDALYAHPGVLEAAVFGVPDARWGEAVHAVVVRRPPSSADGLMVTADELTAHCRTLLAGYKVPKSIELTDQALPKSGAGKVLKRSLREPHWAGQDTRI
jgi:long-chain acyl-CoA synthetase